jgi:hypothetical protein
MNRTLRLAALFALAGAAACTDSPGAVEPILAPDPSSSLSVLQCRVSKARLDVSCTAPAPTGPRADLIVGGQGTYVQLRSTNVAYDSTTQTFSADVTLQNLLGQPVGTEDGTTPGGIKIFFHFGPTVTVGTGMAEVGNPDGVETFTGGTQPYFSYADILAPYERTVPKRWEWAVSPGVQEFSFQLLVAAAVPNPSGVLRWTRERGDVASRSLFAIWGTGPNDMWAGGERTMMYNNGTRWVVVPGDWEGGIVDIGGSSSDDVWAVGPQLLRHFDGRRWSKVTPPVNENFSGVWASSPNDVYVTGGAFGWVLHWDGAAWDTVFSPAPGRRFGDAWGTGPNDVWVTAHRSRRNSNVEDGTIYHWNGAQWDSTSITGAGPRGIWGSSASDIHVAAGTQIHHYDGTSWTRSDGGVNTYTLNDISGTGPNDVWAVGGGYHAGGPEATVLHFDGTQWSEVQTGGAATAMAVFSPNPDKVYVLGHRGMIQKRSGGQWGAESGGTSDYYLSVWPLDDDDAYAAGCGGVYRNEGHGWQTAFATDPGECLTEIWATEGGSQVYAVGWTQSGNGVTVRWDGTAWTRTVMPDTREMRGVWGFGPDDVYAVGYREELMGPQLPVVRHWDGTSWTDMDTGMPYGQFYAVWGTSPDNLYAVGTHVARFNGVYWQTLSVHGMSDVYEDVWGTGPDDVYVTGGGIYHWDGGSWSSLFPRTNYRGYGVWGSGPDDVYVVGTQSMYWNGSSWTDVNIETASTLHDVRGLSPGRVWAVGDGGTVMRGRR